MYDIIVAYFRSLLFYLQVVSYMNKEKMLKASRILVLTFMTLTFINVLLPDSFVIGIHMLPEGDRLNAFQMIIRWFNFSSFVILPVAVYFDRNLFKKIAIYFCLPVSLIYTCMAGVILPCYTSELGTGIVDIRYLPEFLTSLMHNGAFRGTLFFAMCLSGIATVVLLILRDTSIFKFTKKQIAPFALLLLGSIITILPIYALEGIFNTYTDFIFKAFSSLHIGWILLLIAEGVALTLIFRKRSYEDRYILVLVLALSLFLQYNQLFSSLGELTCKRMPFQLCNIAAYLILVSIVTKNRSLFLFNILINVAGGLIALFVMDAETSNGILSKGNIHYIVEHHNVILTPLLCLFLGIFKPIEKKDFKAFVKGFSLYFIFIFVIGTVFNSIYLADTAANDYFKCNYLFMFDKETAARLLPFAGSLFDIKLNIGPIVTYPLVQALVYIAFFAIGTGMFFLLKWASKQRSEKLPEIK